MVSVSSSSNAAFYPAQRSVFSKLDTNSDGALSKDEFVAGRPKEVSEAQASSLYSRIDSEDAGSITEEQFNASMGPGGSGSAAASPFSNDAMAVLMLMSPQGGPPSVADIYADIDADGDGGVTEAEFVAARPDDVSEEDAAALFATIDTEGTGSITEEQFANSMPGPGGPPPGGMPPQAMSSEEAYDALDTNEDGVVSLDEFLAGRPEDVTEEQATALFESFDTEGTGSISEEQFAALAPPRDAGMRFSDDAAANGLDELLALIASMSTEDDNSTVVA
ncbi:MAG TPA: EF-hand domain-containing protein [Sinorhizobium sp.]|nr:EF-hand domain-containing protein [Sinorhizobium sp.]